MRWWWIFDALFVRGVEEEELLTLGQALSEAFACEPLRCWIRLLLTDEILAKRSNASCPNRHDR